MSAADLLSAVRDAGGSVVVIAGGRLKVVAPSALLPDFLVRARAAKPELIALLAGPHDPDAALRDGFYQLRLRARDPDWWENLGKSEEDIP